MMEYFFCKSKDLFEASVTDVQKKTKIRTCFVPVFAHKSHVAHAFIFSEIIQSSTSCTSDVDSYHGGR